MLIAIDLTLLTIYVLVPGIVIGWGNAWRSRRVTFYRSVAAVAAAWLWLVLTTGISAAAELRLARSEAEMELATSGDGPRMVGVVLLGWAPSAVLAALWWFLSPGRWRAKRRRAA